MEETQLANGFENLQKPKKEEEIEHQTEHGGHSHQSRVSGSRRTRSQVAPDWTTQESIILVNEIVAVEGDCRNTLSSFQKWKIVVENCNTLEVNRSLNQCRRKWDSLLGAYRRIKQWESEGRGGSYWALDCDRRKELGLSENFDTELFKAIDDHVKAEEGRLETDPDSDPEAEADADVLKVIVESGSKKQRRRVMPQKRYIEGKVKRWKRSIGEKIKHEHRSLEEEVDPPKPSIDMKHEKSSVEENEEMMAAKLQENEEMMAAKLQENAELINAILRVNLVENDEYRLADMKNIEAFQTDFTRRQGDQLIACLGSVADTLDQLCRLVQNCG